MRYFLVSIFTLLMLSGCSNSPQPDPIVKVVGKCHSNDIKIRDIKGRIKNDGFMQAQVIGENTTNSYFLVEYRVVWFDENDFTIDTIFSNWNTVPAYINEPFYINVVSPSTNAKSFRIYLKKDGKEICNEQYDGR